MFRWGYTEGLMVEPHLEPDVPGVEVSDKLRRQCFALADQIPGATTDEGANVTGPTHALNAVLEAAGKPQEWKPRVMEHRSKYKLPAFQQYGAGFTFANMDTGCVNNDDIGLGKTVQTIAAMTRLPPQVAKLVLCPGFLRSQWKSEVERWVPMMRGNKDVPDVHVLWPASDRRSKVARIGNPEWVIAFYTDAERALEYVGKREYILIVDEAHNFRTLGTKRGDSVHVATLFASGRVGLTASLLYNDAAGMYPMLNLLSPGAWGSYWAFAKRYASATENQYGLELGELSHAEEFRKRLSLCSFRRTQDEVGGQLPFETRYQTIWLEAPPNKLAGLRGAMSGVAGMAAHHAALAEAKVTPVVEQVRSDREAGLGSITFTWLRDHSQKIAAQLPDSCLVLGGADSGTRLDRIQQYVSKCRVRRVVPAVVGTLDALGEGANLQWAKTVNLASLDYTPDRIKQAVGRAARMGQTGTVQIRIFACKSTADEHYISILQRKLKEQFQLDGKKEKAKQDLYEALAPRAVKDALASMYERLLKEEQAQKK